jgi:hypothetical protein
MHYFVPTEVLIKIFNVVAHHHHTIHHTRNNNRSHNRKNNHNRNRPVTAPESNGSLVKFRDHQPVRIQTIPMTHLQPILHLQHLNQCRCGLCQQQQGVQQQTGSSLPLHQLSGLDQSIFPLQLNPLSILLPAHTLSLDILVKLDSLDNLAHTRQVTNWFHYLKVK